ncbi:cysteine-rich CWC family protein [Zhongshania sp.]|uniref:cysteine-rich CWC family protein n=1 Tax=Zhongshania sp. TaxID=1971902 RepID=UPI003568A7AC
MLINTAPEPATQCPLCDQDNQCAVATGRESSNCWCMQASLDNAAKQQAANRSGPPRCICPKCGRVTT